MFKRTTNITIVMLLVVQFFIPNLVGATNNTSTCEILTDAITPIVTATANDSGVLVDWQQIDHDRFSGYKLVISKTNPNPKYSEDGYLKYITDKNTTSYLVNNSKSYKNGDFGYYLQSGESYYFSVTAVYNCGYKLAGNAIQATYQGATSETEDSYVTPVVTAVSDSAGVTVNWDKISHSKLSGYKLVISKTNPNPKYSEDGYLKYITDKNTTSYLVNNSRSYKNGDFGYYLQSGESYYFSVTALYSNGTKIAGNAIQHTYEGPTNTDKEVIKHDKELDDIKDKARLLTGNRIDEILSELRELRNLVKEQQTQIMHLSSLTDKLQNITEVMRNAIQNFVTYGVDDNTKRLGEGERAAVVYSYEKAFGKLPQTESDLEDTIKIANGRYPAQRNLQAEQNAINHFQTIYLRLPDRLNNHDEAAIIVMTYGLRQKAENRNLISEERGIEIFKDIFGYVPESTEDWNIMQAITYSGASR